MSIERNFSIEGDGTEDDGVDILNYVEDGGYGTRMTVQSMLTNYRGNKQIFLLEERRGVLRRELEEKEKELSVISDLHKNGLSDDDKRSIAMRYNVDNVALGIIAAIQQVFADANCVCEGLFIDDRVGYIASAKLSIGQVERRVLDEALLDFICEMKSDIKRIKSLLSSIERGIARNKSHIPGNTGLANGIPANGVELNLDSFTKRPSLDIYDGNDEFDDFSDWDSNYS